MHLSEKSSRISVHEARRGFMIFSYFKSMSETCVGNASHA